VSGNDSDRTLVAEGGSCSVRRCLEQPIALASSKEKPHIRGSTVAAGEVQGVVAGWCPCGGAVAVVERIGGGGQQPGREPWKERG